jgi:PAS domain S-box-containing protein
MQNLSTFAKGIECVITAPRSENNPNTGETFLYLQDSCLAKKKGIVISIEKDTDDSHRSDETLPGQENYLKTIFNSVQIGLLIIDPETHSIFDVNPKAAELIGLERNKIVGTVCNQFICPVEAGKCPITDLGQNLDNSERILLKADGGRLPILKTVIHIPIDGHEYLLESFLDISERKIIESELQESEAKFRDLAERALVGIYLFQDGIFRHVNPKFACQSPALYPSGPEIPLLSLQI